jgi:hypothetical protein
MSLIKRTRQKTSSWIYQVESGGVDTSGYATISNTGALGEFVGATVPALASATYDLDVRVDGAASPGHQLAIALLDSDDWTGIAAKIQVQLRAASGSTETVVIDSDGKIRVTSATDGSSSTIIIEVGTTGSGGGDLIAAITALGADYTATIDTPVNGVEGAITIELKTGASTTYPAKDWLWIVQVRTSAGIEKTGFKTTFDKDTGLLTIADEGSAELAADDIITVIAVRYNV